MKELDLNGITYLRPVPWGTSEWYYGLDYSKGDIYEAQQLFQDGREISESHMYLVHYPDAKVFLPLTPKKNLSIGEPVYYDQKISFPAVDFDEGSIGIYQFDCKTYDVSVLDTLPLDTVDDCFNLRLFQHPLTLSRQPLDGALELIWPKRMTIGIGPKESFFYREEEKLYFNTWFEDPDYREETIIRSAVTGEILEKLSGDISIMPNGEVWHLK